MTKKILQNFNISKFQKDLITWFQQHQRDLPWRKTDDPYAIWVSEIMLQQTKVDTVIGYYEKFMQKYPSVYHLAAASEQEVLKQWEGLGYYSRARNLHAAVKEVVETYGGKVPQDKESLSKLKGIGPYTLGAIMSIAFRQPEPAVDGNVMRVLARILMIEANISEQKTRRLFEDIVKEIIAIHDPSSFNQGLMELGALICTPQSPKCNDCPVRVHCRAEARNLQTALPVKRKKQTQQTKHYVTLIVKDDTGRLAIEQRPNKGLLANMWQFPMLASPTPFHMDALRAEIQATYKIDEALLQHIGSLRHVFSHLIWEMDIVTLELKQEEVSKLSFTFVNENELANFPFSVAHLKIIEMLQKL